MAQKVIQKDLDGNAIRVWPSAYSASESLNCSSGQIRKHCEGLRPKPVGGFNWEYDTNDSPIDNVSTFITPKEVATFGKYVTPDNVEYNILQGPDGMFLALDKNDMTCKNLDVIGENVTFRKIG